MTLEDFKSALKHLVSLPGRFLQEIRDTASRITASDRAVFLGELESAAAQFDELKEKKIDAITRLETLVFSTEKSFKKLGRSLKERECAEDEHKRLGELEDHFDSPTA